MDDFMCGFQVRSCYDRSQSPQRGSIRIKSEAPLDTQIRSASTHDLDHQRRLRALQGLAPNMPNIGDILNDFQPPEKSTARPVKTEPVEEVNINPATLAMLAKISPKVGKAPHYNRLIQQNTVVDLTGIDDTPDNLAHRSPTTHHETTDVVQQNTRLGYSTRGSSNHSTSNAPLQLARLVPLTKEQVEAMDQTEIPQDRLREVQAAYQRSQRELPSHITTWSALKIFAAQHPITLLKPDNIRHAQTELFHSTGRPLMPPPRPDHTTYSTSRFMTANDGVQINRAVSRMPRLKEEEPDTVDESQGQRDTNQSRIVTGYKRLRQNQRKPRNNPTNVVPNTIVVDHAPSTPPVPTDLQIQRLMEPLDIYPVLLSPDAPENHPHLVQVWDLALVGLPKDRHDHLNLIDTVVSIIYKYDAETRTTIQAFFDTENVKHFFFLFKSRTNKFHSWSVEREGDIITIGIERNQRAPNVKTSESPSAGQYDLTLLYQLRQYASLTNNANNAVASHTLPSYWTLVGTATFPSQPSITNFLYNTPPNRGADSHENFKHPAPRTASTNGHHDTFTSNQHSETLPIPSDRLSILARYMQTTAFTALAMEAEFQVCWGHKVRYDAVLGRVRAAFTNALRGAATQARKREAGEYNRPVPPGQLFANRGSEKPGSGAAIGHLRGGSVADSAKSNEKSANSKKRTAEERTLEEIMYEDVEAQRVEADRRNVREENNRRKRRTKSSRRGSADLSGSEYVDSE